MKSMVPPHSCEWLATDLRQLLPLPQLKLPILQEVGLAAPHLVLGLQRFLV